MNYLNGDNRLQLVIYLIIKVHALHISSAFIE